jgi:hypothetical protein
MKIQVSSTTYLWPYYYLKLLPHNTATVIIFLYEKHFQCSYLKCLTLQMLLKMVSSNMEARLALMLEILRHIVV